jgi:hypothetical protein
MTSWLPWTTSVSRMNEWVRGLCYDRRFSRPVRLGIKHPSGTYDQIFTTVRQLQACWYGALSLTRGRVYRLQLLLALTSAVILGSQSRGTRDHILLFEIRDFPFCRLLRLAGLRWRYSTPPPHWISLCGSIIPAFKQCLPSPTQQSTVPNGCPGNVF